MQIKLEAHEAATIAELLLANDAEYKELKVQWAIKLIKGITPAPQAPKIEN